MSSKSEMASVRLQISEPWDFEIPGKGNILSGVIEGVCQGPPEKNWKGEYLLVSLPEPVTWKGEILNEFLIAPRYEGDTLERIRKGDHVIVGIARVKPNISLKRSKSFTLQQVDYFAIGSVEAVTEFRKTGKTG